MLERSLHVDHTTIYPSGTREMASRLTTRLFYHGYRETKRGAVIFWEEQREREVVSHAFEEYSRPQGHHMQVKKV
jgi:hypothetical protein